MQCAAVCTGDAFIFGMFAFVLPAPHSFPVMTWYIERMVSINGSARRCNRTMCPLNARVMSVHIVASMIHRRMGGILQLIQLCIDMLVVM